MIDLPPMRFDLGSLGKWVAAEEADEFLVTGDLFRALVRLARADVALADEQKRAQVWSDEQEAKMRELFDTPESVEWRAALAPFLPERT